VGCLTKELSERAGKVVSVELDKALKPVLAETLADCENVEIVFGDVLKQDLPALVEERMPGMRHVVCANLPYNVTSPLLTAFLEAKCFETVTVMIQREVARRICAGPGSADYGAFGIFVQWHAAPELLFDVPPSCFVPQPKVTSSVIRLTRREKPPVPVRDEALLFRVVRAAFNQRRKTLVNALSSQLPGLEKGQVEEILVSLGFDPRVRGEALDIEDFVRVTDEISAAQIALS
jgi:16S rRNA (adenine1518-N6/adenine1519-N6)-dimethyltransferase